MSDKPAITDREKLISELSLLREGSFGLDIVPDSMKILRSTSADPSVCRARASEAAQIFAIYASLFYILPSAVPYVFGAPPTWWLINFQIYGSLWAAWATLSSGKTADVVCEKIELDLLPYLSDRSVSDIHKKIRRQFVRYRILAVSWLVGFACAILAGYLVSKDVETRGPFFGAEICWWVVGWTILFTTSASVVRTSRFYVLFTAAPQHETEKIYPLDPARSAMILHCVSIARTMFFYWFGIAISIALIVPFGVKKAPLDINCLPRFSCVSALTTAIFRLDFDLNSFVLFFLVFTSICSIGVGSYVVFKSEAAIRRAVRKTYHQTLEAIENKLKPTLSQLENKNKEELEVIKRLMEIHNSVIISGSYKSIVISGLTVLLPFVPLITLLRGK